MPEKILASSLVISLLASIFFMPNQVHAQSPLTYVTGFGLDLLEVGYSNGKIWALANNGTQGTTGNNWLYEVDPADNSIDALYNITRSKGALAWDLWCSPIYCYTVDESTTASAVYQIATITGGGETKGDITLSSATFTQVSESIPRITGRYLTSGDVTQLFITFKQTANTTVCIAQYDGLSLSLTQDACNGFVSWGGRNNSDIYFYAPNATDWHAFATVSAGGVEGLIVYNLYTDTIECGVVSNSIRAVQYHGTSTNPYLGLPPTQPTGTSGLSPVTGEQTAGDTLFYDRACVQDATYTITETETGLASVILRTALFSEETSLAFFQESGANARISVTAWDGLTFTVSGDPVIYDTNPAVSQSSTQGRFVIMPTLELIMVPLGGSDRRIVILDYSSLVPEPPTPPSDTNLPPQSITDVVGGLLCTSGLIAPDACDPDTGKPTNTDPETNGSGLFLTWFLFLFTGGIMIGVSRKFTFSLTNIPAEFWLGLVVLIMGISWYLGWIPDIIFYAMIVGLAGLFAFGLYRQMARGGG